MPEAFKVPLDSGKVGLVTPVIDLLFTIQRYVYLFCIFLETVFCYWPQKNVTAKVKRREIPDKTCWTKGKVSVLTYTGLVLFHTVLS